MLNEPCLATSSARFDTSMSKDPWKVVNLNSCQLVKWIADFLETRSRPAIIRLNVLKTTTVKFTQNIILLDEWRWKFIAHQTKCFTTRHHVVIFKTIKNETPQKYYRLKHTMKTVLSCILVRVLSYQFWYISNKIKFGICRLPIIWGWWSFGHSQIIRSV